MSDGLLIRLACDPPATTAQTKRVRVVNGRPVFFQSAAMRVEAAKWAALLRPFVPASPILGPVALSFRLVYRHLKATAKRDQASWRYKVSRPDAGNAIKHLEDVLMALGFFADDSQVARLTVEKYHGPAADVGIEIGILPLDVPTIATVTGWWGTAPDRRAECPEGHGRQCCNAPDVCRAAMAKGART